MLTLANSWLRTVPAAMWWDTRPGAATSLNSHPAIITKYVMTVLDAPLSLHPLINIVCITIWHVNLLPGGIYRLTSCYCQISENSNAQDLLN